MITDMVHACSNEKVAQAAISCIGDEFARRVLSSARRRGLGSGRFVAVVMRRFRRNAKGEAREALQRRMAIADQPLLTGLQQIVEAALIKDSG
jgi:hypothetical protein